MRSIQIVVRLVVGACVISTAAFAIVAGVPPYEAGVVAAQAGKPPAPTPRADEYYAVKSDWIRNDRSILTIKHTPSGSCYVLVYPTGETLMPVEKDRCASASVEK